MARLLLSCDDYIFKYKGNYYFKSQEWADFYQRYLHAFEVLRICNRVIEEDRLKTGRIRVEDKRIEIHPLPIFHGPVEYAKSYFAVGRAMKSAVIGCDAAILRLPSTVAQRLSGQVIKGGIPYATEIVFDAGDGAETAKNIFERFLWRIIHKKMQDICHNADGVSCVTEKYLQRSYYSTKQNHFTSHYSTLALNKSFFSSPRRYPTKKILTIAHVDLQIGLHSRKGTDIIIQALSKLRKQGIIVNVAFAGDDWDNSTGRILEYAKEYGIGGQVTCPGFLSRKELGDFLEKSDLFVLPTRAEGLPRVIIEAIAKGLPTVTTPASGNPELISQEWLVDFDDVDGYAEKIKKLVQDKKLYERVSQENYNHSLKYESSILQERRDQFYSRLRQLCK